MLFRSAPAGRTEGASPRVEQLVGAAGQAGGGGAGDGGARCGGGVGSIRGTDAAAQVAVREQGSCTHRLGQVVTISFVPFFLREFLSRRCTVPHVTSYLVPPVRCGPSPLAPCPVPPVISKLVPPVRRGPSPLTPNRRNRFRLSVWPRHSSCN